MVEKDAEIVRLYNLKFSSRVIADKVKISNTQVNRILKRNNVQKRSLRTDKETEAKIIKLYLFGESSEKIAKDFSLNPSTICRIVKRNGEKIRSSHINKRKYEINHDFFEKIDIEEKAYLLGFMFADGNVHKLKNFIKICVHEKDEDILHKFIKYIFVNKSPNISIDRAIYKYITITSSKIKKDLINRGCVPAKTFLVSIPDLPYDMYRHFFRGVFDGDGCINVYKNRLRAILTGSLVFLEEIKIFADNIGINSHIHEVKENVGDLTFSGINANKFLDYIYMDSIIYLDRKYSKYEQVKRTD